MLLYIDVMHFLIEFSLYPYFVSLYLSVCALARARLSVCVCACMLNYEFSISFLKLFIPTDNRFSYLDEVHRFFVVLVMILALFCGMLVLARLLLSR